MQQPKLKHIAIIGVGMLRHRTHRGIPAMELAFIELIKHYRLTLYSFIPVDKSAAPVGMTVRCVPFRGIPQKLQYIWLGVLLLWDHFRDPFSLVQTQSPFPGGVLAHFIKKYCKVPWLLSFHAGEAECMPDVPYGDLLHPILSRENPYWSPKADALLALSQCQAERIRWNLKLKQRMYVIPRGIFPGKWIDRKLVTPIEIIFISRYQPVKDIDTLLQTIALLKDQLQFKVHVVGEDYGVSFFEKLEKYAVADNIVFHGSVSYEQIPILLGRVHILVHTSRSEGVGMVILEAMAYGVAVCSTHVGIAADLSRLGCCYTVDPGDASALASAVLKLIENSEEYEAMRKRAYNYVKSHDMNWYIKTLSTCYEEVMK